ncbi:MAG: hypothetical protein ACOC2U_02080 [bacterium]
MKIAILGWGSLIWNPGNLGIDKTKGKNGWCDDGPMLPIEFARISRDGRLTLVIVPGEKKVQTLYAISKNEALDLAVQNLAVREGCRVNKIGSYNKQENEFLPDNFKFQNEIKSWIEEKENIDGVIWTNLGKKFKDKIGLEWNKENVVNYLDCLPVEIKALAEEYVRKAPDSVNSKIRKIVVKELGWTKIHF